jgi:hypothetical protein
VQDDLSHISHSFIMRERISSVNLASVVLIVVFAICINRVFALSAAPATDVLTSKLTDTLNSVTSNISTSIQDDVDKVISSTMDILIDSSMSQLGNATILENSDSLSTVKYVPDVDVNEQTFPVFSATN